MEHEQLQIGGLVRNDHRDTARAAAVGIAPAIGTLRRRVFDCIAASDGVTDEQIQQLCDMNPSTERPRRVELVRAGLISDSGERRATRAGRRAAVWKVTPP